MKQDYQERVAQVIRYIEENSGRSLTLDELAGISHFSKYHFSRIFSAFAGITPAAYVNQVRVHKAALYLKETCKTMLDISELCGFESISTFNSVFKKHYGKTPSEVRKDLESSNNRNIPAAFRKNPEESAPSPHYDGKRTNSLARRAWDMNISLRELPDMEVAYVRHVGSYFETKGAWSTLLEWAGLHGITAPEQAFIGVSLDDGSMVDEQACRYDACVTLPPGFNREAVSGKVEIRILPGGLYAAYPYYDTAERLVLTYQSLFGQWLPDSGFEADDRCCLEFVLNDPFMDPERKCKVDLCIPVRRKEIF